MSLFVHVFVWVAQCVNFSSQSCPFLVKLLPSFFRWMFRLLNLHPSTSLPSLFSIFFLLQIKRHKFPYFLSVPKFMIIDKIYNSQSNFEFPLRILTYVLFYSMLFNL
jgi:hypothetical protein